LCCEGLGFLRRLPATATAATTAATFAATTSAATTTTAAALWLRTGFVHIQSSPAHLGAIQGGDCLLSVFRARHLDETEAAGTACVAVGHDRDPIHLSVRFEQLAQFFFRRVEIQVSNKDVLQARASGVELFECSDFGGKSGGT